MINNIFRSIKNMLLQKNQQLDKFGNNKKLFINNIAKSVYYTNNCIYIHIPKTAGISVSQSLFGIDSVGHYKFADYAKVLDNVFVKNAFKFTFVRNPYNRIYSAYNYLLQGGRGHVNDIAYQKQLMQYLNFENFVLKYIGANYQYDMIHFEPQTEFLKFNDEIIFDFIGKLETLDEDYKYVADKLGVDNALLKTNVSTSEKNHFDKYSPEMINIINVKYQEDFEIFGYDRL